MPSALPEEARAAQGAPADAELRAMQGHAESTGRRAKSSVRIERTEDKESPQSGASDAQEGVQAEPVPTWEEIACRYFTEMHAYRDLLWECLPLLNTAADQGAMGDFDGMYSHVCDVLGIPDDLMARDPDVVGGVVAARKAIRLKHEQDSKAK
jgi:hypothetical protein